MGRPVRGSILLFVGCFLCCFVRFCLFGFGCVPFLVAVLVLLLRFLFSALLSRLAGRRVAMGGVVLGRLAAVVFLVSAFRARGFVFLCPLFPSCGVFLWVVPVLSGRLFLLLFLAVVALFSRFGCFSPKTKKRKQKPLEVSPAWQRRLSRRRSPRDRRQS